MDIRKALGFEDYRSAACCLGVSVAAIRAVAEVETSGKPFLTDGRVRILFERHVFYKRLRDIGNLSAAELSRLACAYPDIVNPKAGGYKGGVHEWRRLESARTIHSDIADESASWGRFQIMGYHWRTLGYESVQAFTGLMGESEAAHLEAFVRFLEADRRLVNALRGCDWRTFARIYNGPAYAKNRYDQKLTEAYTRFSKEVA